MAEKLEKKPEVTQEPIVNIISKAYDAASLAAQSTIRDFGARVAYKDNLDRVKDNFLQGLLDIIKRDPEDIQGGGGVYSMNLGDKKAAKAFASVLRDNLPKEYEVTAKGTVVLVEVKAILKGNAGFKDAEA